MEVAIAAVEKLFCRVEMSEFWLNDDNFDGQA
jgi:hypothetical protein